MVVRVMGAVSSSETSVNNYQTIRCNIPEDNHLHTCFHDNLRLHHSWFLVLYYMLPRIFSQYSGWPRTGRPGFDPRQRQRIFLLASASRPTLGPTQPPVQWVPGALSPGVKVRPRRDVDHPPHLAPRLRISRGYTSSLPKRLHGV
jgi:hypothetical protein